MIALNLPTKTLEVVLNGAVATNQLPITASYRETGDNYSALVSTDLVTAGATAVVVVSAPRGKRVRMVTNVSVYNADTAPVIVTVRLNRSATLRPMAVFSLAVGSTLSYTEGLGWQVLTSSGALTQVEALASPLPIAAGGTGAASVADVLTALAIEFGADDSGGSGYQMLRRANPA